MTIITGLTTASASPMSTAWTLTAQQICMDALEYLGAIGANETPSASDMNSALRALNGVLKELPLSGLHWPKLSATVELVWDELTAQTITLPDDYYNYPVVRKTANGETVPLTQITHAEWIVKQAREETADQPTHFYVSQEGILYFWPVPTIDPQATLQYQRIVADVSATSVPEMPQFWLNPLGYGVANELSLKFGVDQATRLEINQRWQDKRKRAMESSIPYEAVAFSVMD